MKNLKRKKFIDFRENFQKKTKLIEDLKVLISSDLNLKEKEDIFNSIRRKWITFGKVPSHLAFNLNNSYNHQIKLICYKKFDWYVYSIVNKFISDFGGCEFPFF